MHLAGLLAVLLLAVAVLAGNATLTCTVVWSYTVDTTDDIRVSFKFESIAPVFPDYADRFVSGNLVYSPAESARWDRPLKFNMTLEHYAPNQSWRIYQYRCVYNNSGSVQVRYYDVVAQTPQRTTTTATFTVPPTAAEHSASTTVRASRPLGGGYCSAPPTLESWPNCPAFRPDPNKVTVEHPDSWEALRVNGRRPGDVVSAPVTWFIMRQYVNATIPDPWEYGINSDVGTLSYVEVDGGRYGPDAANVPVRSSVHLHMVGMPKRWGEVKVKGDLDVPLYVKMDGGSRIHPDAFCRPPSCFVLRCINISGTYYYILAVRTGANLTKITWMHTWPHGHPMQEAHLPLGSILRLEVTVKWTLPKGFTWPIAVVVIGTPFFRIINDPTYYEEIAKKGKLKGPLKPGLMYIDEWSVGDWASEYYQRISLWRAGAAVVVAVDEHVPSIVFDMYAWPLPLPEYVALSITPGSIPDTAVAGFRHYYSIRPLKSEAVWLSASVWLSEALKQNYPEISGGRRADVLSFLHGEPATYYLGNGDQRGMVFLRTTPRYENTAADINGTLKLNYTTGITHTDVAVFSLPFSLPRWGGWTQPSSPQPSSLSSWLVFLVPTMACRSMFCTSLSPELVGPLPPTTGDRALPNMGYSIMLMHLGPPSRHRVKVYVEDGYVASSGPPINVARVRNYTLVEIDREWSPLEAVVVGPGWWAPIRPLNHCGSMPVNASTMYTTPGWIGPVKIIVEDNGVSSTYVFHVTDDVGYRITTRTPAPASITTTPFNVTAYVTLGGVPYHHALYGYGEGGRLSPPACASTWHDNAFLMSQLALSGDFWGSFGLTYMPLKPVQIRYNYTKPQLELVEPWRGLVRVRAEGPVAGFAFYARRGGTWVKIGEAGGSCLLVNASRLFPWDPVLVLPLVGQELDAAPGSTVAIWRPETALLFKTWADVVGYPKGARSVLAVVRRC